MSIQKNAKAEVRLKTNEPVFKTPYEKAFGAYIALTGLIVFFIPADILKTYPWTVEFTDFMAAWVPQIDLITSLGVRPELNRFYYSVLWAMSPGFFVICVLMSWNGRQRTYPFWNLPLAKSLPYVLVAGAVMYASIHGGWITDTNNGVLQFMLGNRLGMGYLGNLFYVTCPVMFAGGLFAFCVGWLSGEVPRHMRRQSIGGR